MFLLNVLRHRMLMKFYGVAARFMPNPRPMVFAGSGSSVRLCQLIRGYGVDRVLLVTDAALVKFDLHRQIVEHLQRLGVEVRVFDQVEPNPTEQQMNAGIAIAKAFEANAVLAVGGGSPMDAAKIIAAGVTNDMPIARMEGAFKLKKRPLPLFAVPTTAGTGSEVTIAAVVANTEQRRKYTVADTKMVPYATALDPDLMLGLPPHVTAATGMNVLTHAVEAFICTRANESVRINARVAIGLVFKHLRTAYRSGSNVDAREAMAIASYHAGMAISDVAVGYVHAIAHQLGGLYHVPHGLANAVILPHILQFSKDKVITQLAELALLIGAGEETESSIVLAQRFIDEVRLLSRDLDIPGALPVIESKDVRLIVQRAMTEAFTFFAVPKYMNAEEGARLVYQIKGAA